MTDFPQLSKKQLEVYDLFYNQNLSISEIAKRRGTTFNAVKKIVRTLIKKKAIETGFKQGSKKVMPIIMPQSNIEPFLNNRYYRYHNLHFIITPYYFFDRYKNVEKGFGIPYGKWTITFNKKNIEIQLKRHESFDSKDIDECRRIAEEALTDILYKL